MINVTKSYLPDPEKYKKYVDDIFESHWLTNNGTCVQKLENRLASYLGVKNIVLVSNGTSALEVAYRALGLTGNVITTPFSFVATTNSLLANNLVPYFADIASSTFNLDPNNIEALIDDETSAIVPVHVFGNSCLVEQIDSLAKKHKLKVVYDAAHAFSVNYLDKSVLNYGDISTLSFHSTKLFHTIEGGALIINDDSLVPVVRQLINFGINCTGDITEPGTNSKMNEFQAAMGLCILDDIDEIIKMRMDIDKFYISSLSDIVTFQETNFNSTKNYSYFPILLENEKQLHKTIKLMNDNGVFPRRYFFPSLDTLTYLPSSFECSVSRDIASRILCLPIYPGLEIQDQIKIVNLLRSSL